MFTGLLILSIKTQNGWWISVCGKYDRPVAEMEEVIVDGVSTMKEKHSLLTLADRMTVIKFSLYFNQPHFLIKIAFPTLLSLALCPASLYLYPICRDQFWPPSLFVRGPPNINGAISCFLTPAGLVYAIAFGFAFQESAFRQNDMREKLSQQLSMLQEIVVVTSMCYDLTSIQKTQIFKYIKDDLVDWMKMVIKEKKNHQMNDSLNGKNYWKPNTELDLKFWCKSLK